LSHRFDEATEMVDAAEKLSIPLMAGSAYSAIRTAPSRSSIPTGPVKNILIAGCGPLELFGFDAVALMQSLLHGCLEHCSAVSSIRCRAGNEVWRAGDAGEWRWDLLHAALAHALSANLGDVRDNVGSIAMPGMPATPPIAAALEFANGVRGTALLLNGHLQEIVAAIQYQDGSVFSCRIDAGPAPGLHHLDDHAADIDLFFSTRQPRRPIDADLACTGVLERIMQSHAEGGPELATPELKAF
jgi:hypothetical protein